MYRCGLIISRSGSWSDPPASRRRAATNALYRNSVSKTLNRDEVSHGGQQNHRGGELGTAFILQQGNLHLLAAKQLLHFPAYRQAGLIFVSY